MKHAAEGLRAAVVMLHNGGSPRVKKAFLVGRDDSFPFCVDRNEVSICASFADRDWRRWFQRKRFDLIVGANIRFGRSVKVGIAMVW
jgi:hypothetical protein